MSTDDDELAAFAPDRHRPSDDTSPDAAAVFIEDLLVFTLGNERFAVQSQRVLSVIPHRAPSRVPHGSDNLAGLVQDQGRLVALVRHPLQGASAAAGKPRRIVVCNSPRGFIGLPATSTVGVSAVALARAVGHGEVFEDERQPTTFVDPDRVVRSLVGT